MLQKFFATAAICLACCQANFAQENSVASNSGAATITPTANDPATPADVPDKKPTLTISGSADVYYRYDVNKQILNNKTSFTNSQNAFTLGMASVKLEHVGNKVGVVADLGFGARAKDFSYNETGLLSAVKQLYVTYSPKNWLKFTAGTWATHVGYELVDPQLNRNYSMSYLFTNGPFTHTGVKADITKGKHGIMLGVSNATDYRMPPLSQINKKFLIAQYSLAIKDNMKLYLNYAGGQAPDSSKASQLDLVFTATLSKKWSVGLNLSDKSVKAWDGGAKKNMPGEDWKGAATYINYDPVGWFGLTLRSEYFDNKKVPLADGNGSPFNTSLFVNTVSANFKADGFTFIPEIRFETAKDPVFADKAGAFTKKNATSFILAAIYHF
jgi:hypothetical protein